MKEFTKYTFHLTLSIFSALSILFVITTIVFIINGVTTSSEILKDHYILQACIYGLLSIASLVFGFILSSIIYLLRYIAYKDEK